MRIASIGPGSAGQARETPATATPATATPATSTPATLTHENRALTSLRGFAAVWVIFSHVTLMFAALWGGWSWRLLRSGYMGVDVFFVLSGFILGVVYRSLAPADVPRFFARRMFRLYPLNIAILAAMAVLSATVLPMGAWTDPRLLPVFVLMVEGYAVEPIPAWNPVTWSVGIELACYACFPLAVLGIRRLPTPVVAVAAAAALALAWWVQGFCLGWPVGWRGLARGMGDFWPGVLLAALALRLPRCDVRLASVGELLAVTGLLAVVALDQLRLVPVFTGLLICFLFSDSGVVARAMRARWCFWLGEISFSIYLLFGLLLPWMSGLEPALARHLPEPAALVAFIAIYLGATVSLAHITHRTIERPCRDLLRSRRRRIGGGVAGQPT